MFLSRCKQQISQNQNSTCFYLSVFKAVSISYFALRALGLSHFVLVARCFRHGSLLCPSSNFIHSVSFHPLHPLCYLHWVSFHFIHFSHFQSTGYQLFSSPASSLGLRQTLCKPLCGKQNLVFACIKVCLV